MDIAIITAPRLFPTLIHMVRSMREVGIVEPIHIFSEPGRVEVEGANVSIHIHPQKLGTFRNYDFALKYLFDHGKDNLVCVLMDDHIFTPATPGALRHIENYGLDFGYFNLFTNAYQPGIQQICPNAGWNETTLGWHSWGTAYVMKRDHVEALRAADVYRKTMAEYNQHTDAAVSEAFKQMGLAMFVHNPSISYTIGYKSTIGHTRPTDGLNLHL